MVKLYKMESFEDLSRRDKLQNHTKKDVNLFSEKIDLISKYIDIEQLKKNRSKYFDESYFKTLDRLNDEYNKCKTEWLEVRDEYLLELKTPIGVHERYDKQKILDNLNNALRILIYNKRRLSAYDENIKNLEIEFNTLFDKN